MAKLKGIKKLNKTLTKIFREFDIDEVVFNNEYAYYFVNNQITYKLLANDFGDRFFAEFYDKRFNCPMNDDLDDFLYTLLHEVGHAMANENIQDDILDFCLEEKKKNEKQIKKCEDINRLRELYFEYFNLPDEIMATQWSVKFIKNHPKKYKKLKKKVQKAIFTFYEKNGLEG